MPLSLYRATGGHSAAGPLREKPKNPHDADISPDLYVFLSRGIRYKVRFQCMSNKPKQSALLRHVSWQKKKKRKIQTYINQEKTFRMFFNPRLSAAGKTHRLRLVPPPGLDLTLHSVTGVCILICTCVFAGLQTCWCVWNIVHLTPQLTAAWNDIDKHSNIRYSNAKISLFGPGFPALHLSGRLSKSLHV